jgi:hypothetical protein
MERELNYDYPMEDDIKGNAYLEHVFKNDL